MDRFEIEFETKELAEWHLKIRKVNKSRAVYGYITTYVPMGNDFSTEYKTMKKQGQIG